MAYIQEFTIKGLAGRDDVVHRVLDRNINVFWGLNGAGKTSLLKILNSALANDTTLLRRVPFESAEVQFWSIRHEALIKRTFENSEDTRTEDSEDEFSDMPTLERVGEGLWRESWENKRTTWRSEVLLSKTDPRLDIAYRHTYLPISRMTQVAAGRRSGVSSRNVAIDDEALDADFADHVRRKWQSYTATALTSIRGIQQQGLASILALLFGGAAGPVAAPPEKVDAEQAYPLVRDFLTQQGINLRIGKSEFTTKYENQPELRSVVATIQEVEEEVSEATKPQREFRAVIQKLYSGGKQLLFDHGKTVPGSLHVEWNGSTIPLESLSSGEKQLLRLMLETLSAEEDTLMVDEPELSMHVDWQQVLVESMRKVNPDCQLLLATHSPEVMAEVSPEFVFEL